ncbi:MAG: hypothetical protein FRX48_07271 [Lasallia pustulata]|uniref:RINT-1 family protein n=1 Tax=Lasallia pustulata TaxID=136370 RepID=A0A5M8PHQ4_9LECA|nr:MAG: hypothetical protein FRX48_07271 [Lasallia pustulata]
MTDLAIRLDTSRNSGEERDIRVEDYLNDKLQTIADLDNLDSLLENVRNQHLLLTQQLQDAQVTLAEASRASQAHSARLLQQADKFNKQQGDIDRRLLIVTQSETSDDAVPRFDTIMEKLQRIDIATGYMSLLKEVDNLSAEARNNFRTSPQAALKPYVRLKSLAAALKNAQPAAEGAAPHLVDHVERTAATIWRQMKTANAMDFEEILKKMKWPGKDVKMSGGLEQEWAAGAGKLLDLQEPELKARDDRIFGYAGAEEPLVLLPLEVMVRPLELRFRYHFDGDKPTNRLDKPEYFFSHIFNLLNTYNEFFATYLQPVLQNHFRGSTLAMNIVYIDSTSALITAVLPMLRHKIFSFLPQVARQPQLLSHFMHELMSFDVDLKDDWGYDGGCGADGWKGLTWEVLVKKDWFGKWLQVEKDFALSRYQSIIDSPESGEIDYDSVDPGTTKPTKAAIRVNDLLETITDRYRPLTSFSQKLRFLIDIQIAIFDKFHTRLHSALEAYLTLTSSIARTVQGVSKEEQSQLQGLGGLERLCRVFGSAEYLEKKMRDWSDDVFFLELWDELQDRARRPSRRETIAGEMTVAHVAERTSSAVGSDEDAGGALFDETAGAYRRLRIRSETIMQDMLIQNLRDSLWPYSRINPWASLSSGPEPTNAASLTLTAELDAPVHQLSLYLAFLSNALAQAPLRRIARQVALAMQTYLWDRVLMRHSFSASGIAQFSYDLNALWEVMDRYLGGGQGELGMRRLAEAAKLLNLPAVRSEGLGPEQMEAPASGRVEEGGIEDGHLALWEVERRIFRSNESARDVLEELGFEVITESEARNVLERRIELGS